MTLVLERWAGSSTEEVQTIIRAVYKQVLGNPHVMESERLTIAESQLQDGAISVREFVRAVAKSEFYRSRYFERCAPYRLVELNCLHLLGRAPQDQREVSEHIVRTVAQGFEAEIDSYLDSAEYQASFGENVVPYYRGNSSDANRNQRGYNYFFKVDRGPAQLDSAVTTSQLVGSIAGNSAPGIQPATPTVIGSGTEKRFKISVSGSKFDSPRRTSTTDYLVSANKMSPQLNRIRTRGGRIVSITEVR